MLIDCLLSYCVVIIVFYCVAYSLFFSITFDGVCPSLIKLVVIIVIVILATDMAKQCIMIYIVL